MQFIAYLHIFRPELNYANSIYILCVCVNNPRTWPVEFCISAKHVKRGTLSKWPPFHHCSCILIIYLNLYVIRDDDSCVCVKYVQSSPIFTAYFVKALTSRSGQILSRRKKIKKWQHFRYSDILFCLNLTSYIKTFWICIVFAISQCGCIHNSSKVKNQIILYIICIFVCKYICECSLLKIID